MSLPLLEEKHELELANKWKNKNDENALHELIQAHMRLVVSYAVKYKNYGLSLNDLIQEGSVALTLAIDKIDWEKLHESPDMEKTLKSFISKRIKGAIRRSININRGTMRIPEHVLNDMRNNPNDNKVALFFNSIFSSIDIKSDKSEKDHHAFQIPDKSEPYNIDILNSYLMGLIKQHLNFKQQEVLRLSYGLDCERMSGPEIAKILNVGSVRVSQIKKEAINALIANTDAAQVIDYL